MIKGKMASQGQILATDPSREKIPVGRFGVVEDGVNLPDSVEEDVKGISLCRSYSPRQLRRIDRMAKKKAEAEGKVPNRRRM